jgi:hypothetical protein
MANVTIETYIWVYTSVIQSGQQNQIDADTTAELIEGVLEADNRFTVGGNPQLIDSLVTRLEPGFATKGNTVMRAVRLTHRAETQQLLPQS